MAINRFVAPTMRQALRQVSEELGADAIIVHQQKVPEGVEVLATLDSAEAQAFSQPARGRAAAPPSSPGTQPQQAPPSAGPAPAAPDPGLAAMRDELSTLRDIMETQFSTLAWGSYRQQHPAKASMWRRLQRLGLSGGVCQTLLETLPELLPAPEAWKRLMSTLSEQLPVTGADIVDRGGIFALVGPTGAGKTTTIGKLAARYVLDHGSEGVVLVTTDSYRLGAHDQLRTLSRILNVPLKIAEPGQPISQLLEGVQSSDLVLIDSAGLRRDDPQLTQQLQALESLGPRLQSLLVVAATTQAPVLQAAARTYRTANLRSLVITKLDECASLGEALSLALEQRLPISYTTDGQAIPDDIRVADSRALVRTAIDLAKAIPADDERLAEAYSALHSGGLGVG